MKDENINIYKFLLHYARIVREKSARMLGNSETGASPIEIIPDTLIEKNFLIGTMMVSFVCVGILLFLLFQKSKDTAVLLNNRGKGPLVSDFGRRWKMDYNDSNAVITETNNDDEQIVCTHIGRFVVVMNGEEESETETDTEIESDIRENNDLEKYELDIQEATYIDKTKVVDLEVEIDSPTADQADVLHDAEKNGGIYEQPEMQSRAQDAYRTDELDEEQKVIDRTEEFLVEEQAKKDTKGQLKTMKIEHLKAQREAKIKSTAVAQTKAQAEAQRKAQAEAQRKAQAEAQRKAQAEAQKKAQAEAQKKAQAEAQKKAQAEAQKKAQAEAQKKAQAEAQKKPQAEAQKRVQAEAQKRAQAEAQKRAQAEAQKKTQAEAQIKVQADANRRLRNLSEKRMIVQPKANTTTALWDANKKCTMESRSKDLLKSPTTQNVKGQIKPPQIHTQKILTREKSKHTIKEQTNGLTKQQQSTVGGRIKAFSEAKKLFENVHKSALMKPSSTAQTASSYNFRMKMSNKASTEAHKVTAERRTEPLLYKSKTFLNEPPVFTQSNAYPRSFRGSHHRAYSTTHINGYSKVQHITQCNTLINGQRNNNGTRNTPINNQRNTLSNGQSKNQINNQQTTQINAQRSNKVNVLRNTQINAVNQSTAKRDTQLSALINTPRNDQPNVPTSHLGPTLDSNNTSSDLSQNSKKVAIEDAGKENFQIRNKSDEVHDNDDRNTKKTLSDKTNALTTLENTDSSNEIDGYISDDIKQLQNIKKEMQEEAVELKNQRVAVQPLNNDGNRKNCMGSQFLSKNIENDVSHGCRLHAATTRMSLQLHDVSQDGINKEQLTPRTNFLKSRIPAPTARNVGSTERCHWPDLSISKSLCDRSVTSVASNTDLDPNGRQPLVQRSLTGYSLKNDNKINSIQGIARKGFQSNKQLPSPITAANKNQLVIIN